MENESNITELVLEPSKTYHIGDGDGFRIYLQAVHFEKEDYEMYDYITVEYPENMELIDENINKYFRLANLRIKLVTSNGLNVEKSIDAVLTRIKEAKEEERESILAALHACVAISSQKYISRKSYLKKKRQIIDKATAEIHDSDITDEEKNRITNDLIENSINPYSLERTNSYFDHLFKDSDLPFIKSKYIKSREEALMFASAFIYSGEDDFKFVVELDQGYEKTPVAELTNMVVRRKNNGRL